MQFHTHFIIPISGVSSLKMRRSKYLYSFSNKLYIDLYLSKQLLGTLASEHPCTKYWQINTCSVAFWLFIKYEKPEATVKIELLKWLNFIQLFFPQGEKLKRLRNVMIKPRWNSTCCIISMFWRWKGHSFIRVSIMTLALPLLLDSLQKTKKKWLKRCKLPSHAFDVKRPSWSDCSIVFSSCCKVCIKFVFVL